MPEHTHSCHVLGEHWCIRAEPSRLLFRYRKTNDDDWVTVRTIKAPKSPKKSSKKPFK